jgi:hypothetical protein
LELSEGSKEANVRNEVELREKWLERVSELQEEIQGLHQAVNRGQALVLKEAGARRKAEARAKDLERAGRISRKALLIIAQTSRDERSAGVAMVAYGRAWCGTAEAPTQEAPAPTDSANVSLNRP